MSIVDHVDHRMYMFVAFVRNFCHRKNTNRFTNINEKTNKFAEILLENIKMETGFLVFAGNKLYINIYFERM